MQQQLLHGRGRAFVSRSDAVRPAEPTLWETRHSEAQLLYQGWQPYSARHPLEGQRCVLGGGGLGLRSAVGGRRQAVGTISLSLASGVCV